MAAVLAPACAPSGTPERPPSLLLVTIDTCRADRFGCYGGSVRTPAVDALARRGVRFAACVSPVPLTLPGHTSLLSGLYPARHGVLDNVAFRVGPRTPTLARTLGAEGYRTAAFVSAYPLDARFGLDLGFEVYDDAIDEARSADSELGRERRGGETVDRALAWLGDRGSEPFFLWVHLFDPHAPYAPPSPFDAAYPNAPYDGEVAYADACVGRLLDGLERAGRAADTLVVVTADHAESLGEHGEPTHGIFLYDSALHVPLVMAGPGLPEGRVVDAQASLVDVRPTVLELLEVVERSDPDGESLAPILRGEREGRVQPHVYLESHTPALDYGWSALTGVRGRAAKLIDAPRPEVYDLEADPAELEDLAGRAGERGETLRAAHRRWRKALSGASSLAETAAPTGEELERLEALGYAGGAADVEPTGADPKDMAWVLTLHDRIDATMQAGRYEAALAELDELEARTAPGPRMLRQRGLALLALGRLAEARDAFERVHASGPERAQVHRYLAQVHAGLGDVDRAIRSYERALELRPDDPMSRVQFAMFLLRQGERERGLAELEAAQALEPDFADERWLLGLAWREAGRPDEALEAFEASLAIRDDFVEALRARHLACELREARGDLLEALVHAEAAVALRPENPRALANRARLRAALGRDGE